MYKLVTLLLLFWSTFAYSQFLPGVKHIEVVSEIADSMVLLNKVDVDKINKTYFEKNKLDSVNFHNEQIIDLLESKVCVQDSIIVNNKTLLNNEIALNKYLTQSIEDNTTQYEKTIRRERWKKAGWQTATGIAVIGIILALVLE